MIAARWTGLDEARKAIEALGQELGDEKILVPVLRDQAKELCAEVQARLDQVDDPRTPEKLRDDWIVAQDTDGHGRPFFRVGPAAGRGSRGFIAWFFERGTSKMAAKPMVRPAFDAWAPSFPARAVEALRDKANAVISRLARKAMKGAR